MPRKTTSVLVTDGEHRAALAVVRSLGRAGYNVHVCSTRAASLAGTSRYAASHSRVCDPLEEPARYAHEISNLTVTRDIDVLLPIAEASILALLGHRDLLGALTIPFPDLKTFQQVCDKAYVTGTAAALGVRVPVQRVLATVADRSQLQMDALRFPLVVKPTRSVVGTEHRRAKTGVAYAADRAALDTALDRLPPSAYPILMQERIVGPGLGAFLLRWDGEILATFCHRRIREKPPSGGVSVCCESVPPDSALLESSAALLDALDWQGVAMVEYKLDSATGQPYLMEINGRFWGSLQLAIDAGVDFPALLLAAALGQAPAVSRSYRVGLHSRWFWGDVDHLLARLRHTRAKLALTRDAPGRFRAVMDFLAGLDPRVRGEVLRVDDPAPAFRETVEWLRGA